MVNIFYRLQKAEDNANARVTMEALESKIPLMFRFLGNDDDDVSEAVTQFSQEYITVLKQIKPLSPKQRESVEVCSKSNK